jgi:hypothetical protein
MRRSCTGSITSIIWWLDYADPGMAPIRRSVTKAISSASYPIFAWSAFRFAGGPLAVWLATEYNSRTLVKLSPRSVIWLGRTSNY